jgi:hypothetical protein
MQPSFITGGRGAGGDEADKGGVGGGGADGTRVRDMEGFLREVSAVIKSKVGDTEVIRSVHISTYTYHTICTFQYIKALQRCGYT